MFPNAVAPSEFTRKATALLRFEEKAAARRPVGLPSDDPAEERRRIAAERPRTRVLWHATTDGVESAPLSEWDDCGWTSETAGAWSKGSGWYRIACDDDESIRIVCHYRRDNDREDAPRTSADPAGSRARAEEDLWKRLRVEGADRYQEVRDLRAQLTAAQSTIATHLTTIAAKDARILALEESMVPHAEPPHWATPVADQLAGYLEEAKPLLQPLIREISPAVKAAVQDHLSQGAHTAEVLKRLADAQPVLKRFLDAVRDADGFALRLPEPTPEQVAAHHCPRPACGAERGEPCLDGEIPSDDFHTERTALARLPRELKAAIKKSGAEIVIPGVLVADDDAVIDTAKELCVILEMDAWQAAQEAQEAAEVKTIDAPEEESVSVSSQAAPSVVAPPPVPPPPPAPIPDAEIEEPDRVPGDASPRPSVLVSLDTPEARASFAAHAASRAAELEAAKAKARAAAREIEAKRTVAETAKTDPAPAPDASRGEPS